MYWLTCIFFGTCTMFRGTVHNITHTNHQPQPATSPSNIHYWQGDAAMARWDINFSIMFGTLLLTHLEFLILPHLCCTYNSCLPHTSTTQPHATIILLGNKLKDQRTKKVRNDILQKLSSIKVQVNSPPFLRSNYHKQAKAMQKHPNT
jgi:hypothetical protein